MSGNLAAAIALAATLVSGPVNSGESADQAALAAAAHGFYAAYQSVFSGGGIPDAAARAKLSPFISPALKQLLEDASDAEDAYAKATQGEVPPLVEGDPFSSSFEGATSHKVGACTGDAKTGRCLIALTYADASSKPVTWTDTADLVMTQAGWRLGDIEYGGTWEFGNHGRLSELLRSVIEESKEPVD
jgi:hypothetical protein